jgi:hypothetical protein
MRISEELITTISLNVCIQKHAARPIPVWMRPTDNKDECMHSGCCIRGLSKRGHTDHEWAMLTCGREARKLPMHLLSKLIDLTNPKHPKLYSILAQIILMLKMNPGKYQTFEAMFGPTESHLLYQWWKFAEESETMRLNFLVEYCSSQDKLVFLVKLSETKVIYVRVSLDNLEITEIYSVTDNRFTDNIIRSYSQQIPFIENVINTIFEFENTYSVSKESIRIFNTLSRVFMQNQILQMKQRTQVPLMLQHAIYSITTSQKFKVRHLLTCSALKTMLVNRLVPTGKRHDPTQANDKLLKMVHFYASPKQ